VRERRFSRAHTRAPVADGEERVLRITAIKNRSSSHTPDYGPLIKSQLASSRLTLMYYLVTLPVDCRRNETLVGRCWRMARRGCCGSLPSRTGPLSLTHTLTLSHTLSLSLSLSHTHSLSLSLAHIHSLLTHTLSRTGALRAFVNCIRILLLLLYYSQA